MNKHAKILGKRGGLRRAQSLSEEERQKIAQSGGIAKRDKASGVNAAWIREARLTYARSLGTHTLDEWMICQLAAGLRCLACRQIKPLSKDHIQPIEKNGTDAITNIQPLCWSCNASKATSSTDYRPPDWAERMLSAKVFLQL